MSLLSTNVSTAVSHDSSAPTLPIHQNQGCHNVHEVDLEVRRQIQAEDMPLQEPAPTVTPTRHSRPLASLAPLDRVLADATLDRAFAGAILENLDKRITAPCGWPRPVGKRPSRAKRVPSKRAARSRTASTASGLAPLELPSIAALHSALPPSPPCGSIGGANRVPAAPSARRLQAIKLSAILSSFNLP